MDILEYSASVLRPFFLKSKFLVMLYLKEKHHIPGTFCTEAIFILRIARTEQFVPNCQEKSTVVRRVHGTPIRKCIINS